MPDAIVDKFALAVAWACVTLDTASRLITDFASVKLQARTMLTGHSKAAEWAHVWGGLPHAPPGAAHIPAGVLSRLLCIV